MSFPPVSVARDVCGDIIPTVPVNIDCSLCGLGWPQASGEIMFNLFRGNDCAGSASGLLGDYSYWLNGAYLPGRFRFQCRNPGADAEPNPNEWIAGGEFGWGGTWRIDCILAVLSKTSVKVEGSIRWLNPATMKLEVWTTFSKVMDEDNPQGITDPRRHRVFKSGRVPITPNAASGGAGDPVTGIEFVLGTRPLIIGCGTELCSMWDGAHYYTCFRAEVTDTGGLPALSQMGKSQFPCGGRDQFGQFQPWCNCDRITLRSDGRHESAANADPAFIAEYGHVGSPPFNAVQQVQVGGGLLVKRWPGTSTRIWTQDAAGNWVEGVWTVSQEFGPTIWTVTFGSPVFRTAKLYSLAFPSPNILPDACAPDPAPPEPGTFQWWCVDGTCIQSNVWPPNSTSGPHADLFTCLASGCEPPPPKKWYCANGVCGEYEAAPPGATSGPHDTKAECEASCQPPPPESKWYCVAGNCQQSESMPPGATGGPYNTQQDCQLVCSPPPPVPWWCATGTCIQSTPDPGGGVGPFTTEQECKAQCQPPPTVVWVCPASTGNQGTCIETTIEVATEGGWTWYTTFNECQAVCADNSQLGPYTGYYCVPATNPAARTDYTCIHWGGPNGPPNGAQGGKYDTLDACQAGCGVSAPPSLPFWCVQSDDIAVKQCVQAATVPPGTVSGPHASQVACFENCNTAVDPVVVRIPSPRSMPPPPPPSGNQERYWLPCVHRGDEVPNSGFT